MKREMRAYLAGGGTAEGYLDELERRQRLEISYRDNAEDKLGRMLEEAARSASAPYQKGDSTERFGSAKLVGRSRRDRRNDVNLPSSASAPIPTDPPSPATDDKLKAAYDYWLKANARLKSMGIYELSLPDTLRALQNSLEIDE